MVKDGWHSIKVKNETLEMVTEYEVLTENGYVIRGIKYDKNGGQLTAYPYRACRSGGWDNCSREVKYETFRRGLNSGNYGLF